MIEFWIKIPFLCIYYLTYQYWKVLIIFFPFQIHSFSFSCIAAWFCSCSSVHFSLLKCLRYQIKSYVLQWSPVVTDLISFYTSPCEDENLWFHGRYRYQIAKPEKGAADFVSLSHSWHLPILTTTSPYLTNAFPFLYPYTQSPWTLVQATINSCRDDCETIF